MSLQRAIEFIRSRGTPAQITRMRFTHEGIRPNEEQTTLLLGNQNPDGGWPLTPQGDISSLDTTCCRLAIAEASGVRLDHEAMIRTASFLMERQEADGSWEEDSALSGSFPSWIRPGSIATTVYLTANCGLWLKVLEPTHPGGIQAAEYLLPHLMEDGTVPTYLHAHWLTASLWHLVGLTGAAQAVQAYLRTKLEAPLWPSNLTWLLNSCRLSTLPPTSPLIEVAVRRLLICQEKDGRWASEDGDEFDVDTTLDALTALQWGLGKELDRFMV